MTKEFKEMVDRLARAWNSEDGSYLLITQCGKEDGEVQTKGNAIEIINGIINALEHQILPNVTEEEARIIRRWLWRATVRDEKQRFQDEARNVSPFMEGAEK